MRNYTTQMDAARKGILTPEIKTVAEKEHMETDKLMKLVAEGKVAICANKNHKSLNPEGVGSCSAQRSMSISEFPVTAKIIILRCRK